MEEESGPEEETKGRRRGNPERNRGVENGSLSWKNREDSGEGNLC